MKKTYEPIMGAEEAFSVLRLDYDADNQLVIEPLIDAIPPYLDECAGYVVAEGESYSPIAIAAGQFLLKLWYYGENSDVGKLETVISSLIKALAVSVRSAKAE